MNYKNFMNGRTLHLAVIVLKVFFKEVALKIKGKNAKVYKKVRISHFTTENQSIFV